MPHHDPEHHPDNQPGARPGRAPRPALAALALAAAWIASLVLLATTAEIHPAAPQQPPHPADTSSADGAAGTSVPPTRVVSAATLARLPRATTFTTLAGAPRDPHPQRTPDGVLVHPKRTLPLYDKPGGRPFAALPTRQLGGPTWIPIIDTRPGWVQVLLPSRPNGASAWLPRHAADLRTAQSPYRIVVDRDNYTLVAFISWVPVGIWKIGIGKPDAPTPPGRTFILAALRDPKPTFSKVILPLGAHSTTHTTYGGGPGTVGIHTWPTRDVYGQASSDGCIRVPPDALTNISTTVPIGTPVLIR
jgi:hypothetical protein